MFPLCMAVSKDRFEWCLVTCILMLIFTLTWSELVNVVLQITDVRLPQDSGGGRPKGFGYAEFADKESLVEALKMNNEVMIVILLVLL